MELAEMPRTTIPNPIIAEVSEALSNHHTHTELDVLFQRSGAPGGPPIGNKTNKCSVWLRRTNEDVSADPMAVLGGVLEQFMEIEPTDINRDFLEPRKDRINRSMAKHGLSYQQGGRILGATTATPTRTLEAMIRERDLPGIETEFRRALNTVDTDPPAAVTAACAILEALFKTYIQDNSLELPSDQTIKPLWKVVRDHLGLQPRAGVEQDLVTILAGLTSVVEGVGALRTHAGSAHGRGRGAYQLSNKHARLANHSAHTVATFVLESWDERST
jgi:hypothetical protein